MAGIANLKQWPKGVSGNPGGKPKLPPELLAIKAYSRREITRIISKYGRMTFNEVSAMIQNSKMPVMDIAICRIFLESIEKGDERRLQFLIENTVGKIPDSIEDDEDAEERQKLSEIPLKEIIRIAQDKLSEATEA